MAANVSLFEVCRLPIRIVGRKVQKQNNNRIWQQTLNIFTTWHTSICKAQVVKIVFALALLLFFS